jgi:predicted ABC-type ATPase
MANIIKSVSNIIINNIKKHQHLYSHNQLIYVCGVMGSGKTTFIQNKLLSQHPNLYYSSIDNLIPYFTSYHNNSHKLYQLCRQTGIIITDYLLENNISMIIEGTGINMDTVEYLQKLKNQKYNILTYFLKTDLQLCRDRVKQRNQTEIHKVKDQDIITYYDILWNNNNEKNMVQQINNISNAIVHIDNYSVESFEMEAIT